MRKNAKFLLVSLLVFCFGVNVNAAECSYEKQVELNNIASTVKATYESVEIDTGETENYVDEDGIIDESIQIPVKEKGFIVKVLNITQNLYVTVKNDFEDSEKNYYYSDTNNGTLSLAPTNADQVHTYSIVVKAIGAECSGYELRTVNLITPKYNPYSEMQICKDNSKFEYCQEFISTNEEITLKKISSLIGDYKKEQKQEDKNVSENKNFKDKIVSFIKNNTKTILIILAVVIIVGGITIYIVIKKRWKRLI